ncbi:MAG: helix-turn-helix transcriptional regulator [Planctomycetota bacterium]
MLDCSHLGLNFGKLLRRMRTETLKMSLVEMAERVGLSSSVLKKYERGDAGSVKLRDLAMFAEVFDMTLADLCGEIDDPKPIHRPHVIFIPLETIGNALRNGIRISFGAAEAKDTTKSNEGHGDVRKSSGNDVAL